ncbi:hypothetical protein [Falsiroseomonas sp. E2-1-a20]|uniref:hypothetical protein n=1 Tax=Falsiroseomonas sp. E2-1-a20 TaxID=3239300 RepID=UPI003F2E53E6
MFCLMRRPSLPKMAFASAAICLGFYASHSPGVDAASPAEVGLGTPVQIESPIGTLRVSTEIPSLFGSFDERMKAAGQDARAIIENIFEQNTTGAAGWPTRELALSSGPFSVPSAVTYTLQFYTNSNLLMTRALADLNPIARSPNPLNITIYTSQEAMAAATGARGEEARNGHYDPSTETVSTFLPGQVLERLYPPTGKYRDQTERGAAALVALRRSVMRTFFHEYVHVLQSRSGKYYFLSPFFAEGQAQYAVGRLERLELLYPLAARQHGSEPNQLSSAIQEINRNSLLSPSEYSILNRVRNMNLGDGSTISALLQMPSYEFYDSPEVARFYEIAWAMFLFLDSGASSASDLRLLRSSAEALDADRKQNEFASLETRFLSFVKSQVGERETPPREVLLGIAPFVMRSDSEMLSGRILSAYRAYLPILRAAPDLPDMLAYMGDLLVRGDDRDAFADYYNRALRNQAGGAPTLGSHARILGRYIDVLIELGMTEQAVEKLAEFRHVVASGHSGLDEPTLESMRLVDAYTSKLPSVNSDDEKEQLICELLLGRTISGYRNLISSPIIKEALQGPESSLRRVLQENLRAATTTAERTLQERFKECNVFDLSRDAWFLPREAATDEAFLSDLRRLAPTRGPLQ